MLINKSEQGVFSGKRHGVSYNHMDIVSSSQSKLLRLHSVFTDMWIETLVYASTRVYISLNHCSSSNAADTIFFHGKCSLWIHISIMVGHTRKGWKPSLTGFTGVKEFQTNSIKKQNRNFFPSARSGMSYISSLTCPYTNTKEDTGMLQRPNNLQPGNFLKSCCEWVPDLQVGTTVNFLDRTLSRMYGTWISTDTFCFILWYLKKINIAEYFCHYKSSWIIN